MKAKIAAFLDEMDGNFSSFEERKDESLSNFSPKQRGKIIERREKLRSSMPDLNRKAVQARNAQEKQTGKIKEIAQQAPKQQTQKTKKMTNAIFEMQLIGANLAAPFVAGSYFNVPILGYTMIESLFQGTTPDTGNNLTNFQIGNSMGKADRSTTTFGTAHTVDVLVDTVPTPQFFRSLANRRFKINRLRMQITDITPNGLKSIMGKLTVVTKSAFGKKEQDAISLANFKSPEQMQAGIIDIPLNLDVTPDTAVYLAIASLDAVAASAGQTISLSIWATVED